MNKYIKYLNNYLLNKSQNLNKIVNKSINNNNNKNINININNGGGHKNYNELPAITINKNEIYKYIELNKALHNNIYINQLLNILLEYQNISIDNGYIIQNLFKRNMIISNIHIQ